MKKIFLTLLMIFVPLIGYATNYEITTPGNNVGIGSTNPGQALDVNGTVRINGNLLNAYPDTFDIQTIAPNGLQLNGQNNQGSSIMTYNGNQYAGYWNNDATSHVVLCKRSMTPINAVWACTTYNSLTLPANDSHDGISFGHDENGYIHMCYVAHGGPLHYYISNSPNSIAAMTSSTMLGTNNTQVTYHTFFNDTNGKLYDIFRSGISGNGSTYLYSYNSGTTTWSAATGTGTNGILMDGSVGSTSNAYWTNPFIDKSNNMYLWWDWRYNNVENGVQYMKFNLITGTATQSTGSAQTIPATQSNDEVVKTFSVPSSSDPEAPIQRRPIGVTSDGTVHIVYTESDANGNVQVMYSHNTGSGWSTEQQLTQDISPLANNTGTGASFTGPRVPNLLVDTNDRLYILFKDYTNGDDLAVLESDDKGVNWKRYPLIHHFGIGYTNNMDYQGWDVNHELYLINQFSAGDTITSFVQKPVYLIHWIPREGGRASPTTTDGIGSYNDFTISSEIGYIHMFGDQTNDITGETWLNSSDNLATAITYAPANSTIHLGPGTYTITADLAITKALSLVGSGKGITTIATTTDNIQNLNITSDNVLIKDLTLSNVVGGSGTGNQDFCAKIDATATTIFSNVVFDNVGCTLTNTSSATETAYGFRWLDAGGVMRNVTENCNNNKFSCIGIYDTAASTQEAATTLNIFDTNLQTAGGGSTCGGYAVDASGATTNATMNIYGSTEVNTQINPSCTGKGVTATNTNGILNIYGGSISSSVGNDLFQSSSGTLNIYGTNLVDNTTSGTITSVGTFNALALDVEGTLRPSVFYGLAASTQNVGIGSSNPGQKLDVQGTLSYFRMQDTAGVQWKCKPAITTGVFTCS